MSQTSRLLRHPRRCHHPVHSHIPEARRCHAATEAVVETELYAFSRPSLANPRRLPPWQSRQRHTLLLRGRARRHAAVGDGERSRGGHGGPIDSAFSDDERFLYVDDSAIGRMLIFALRGGIWRCARWCRICRPRFRASPLVSPPTQDVPCAARERRDSTRSAGLPRWRCAALASGRYRNAGYGWC